jgi:hypothetical protein
MNQYFAKLPKKIPRTGGSIAIIQPTASGAPSTMGDINVIEAVSDNVVTDYDIAFATVNKLSVVIGGRLEYTDTRGGSYRSDFCVRTDQTGQVVVDCDVHQQP